MTKPLNAQPQTGRINLPIGMILRCLPQEVLASDITEFEASGAAATEIGLPMNMILSQLPSGKVEVALQDLVPHFPAGYLQPTQSIAAYLPTMISLPLMDVVMRIPPDLLALRPDQKDVDSAVINMADPFTEEILREQAEAARKQQAEGNVAAASPAPQMQQTVAPTPRPASIPLPTPTGAPPMPQANRVPTPPSPSFSRPGGITASGLVRANSPVPPTAPSTAARSISPSGRLPAPTRATAPIPTRPPAEPSAVPTPSTAPAAPPPPRQTGSLPAPRPPVGTAPQFSTAPLRPPAAPQTQPVPALPTVTDTAPQLPVFTPPPEAPVQVEAAPVEEPVAAPSSQPDEASDELQRLAALAMAQFDDSEAAAPAQVQYEPEIVSAPEPARIEEPLLEQSIPEPTPEPVRMEEPPPQPDPIPEPPIAVAPEPVRETKPILEPPPAPIQPNFKKGVTEPLPSLSPPKPKPEPEPAPAATSASVAINLNSCGVTDLLQIPGCSRELAESIVQYRTKINSFKSLEDLCAVPGMTKVAYTNLTGEAPPESSISLSLNEFLGFPTEQKVSLKDVTDRIACWPDVTGCILSQSSGLSLVGTAPAGLDKAAIVAFAPRMFESINKSFHEITGKETDELIIPATGTSFHIFRNRDLYLIILSRLPQMPDRHMKVARFVLAALSIRQN